MASLAARSLLRRCFPMIMYAVAATVMTGREVAALCKGLQTGQGTWRASNPSEQRYDQYWDCPAWARNSYTGFNCQLSLSSNSTSFTYEASLRWQPNECPQYQQFNAEGFVRCLGSRRLFMIGDSMTWQQFASLACLLRDHVESSAGEAPEDGSFMYAGQINLVGGGLIVARAFGLVDDGHWDRAFAPFQPLREEDVMITNFGAHYAHLHPNKYHTSMSVFIWLKLRTLPMKKILWRGYAPAHYPSGASASGQWLPDLLGQHYFCQPAIIGEPWIDLVIEGLLGRCGKDCAHIEWMKIHDMILPRYRAHNGLYGPTDRGLEMDCRHYCFFILDELNTLTYNHMCAAESDTT